MRPHAAPAPISQALLGELVTVAFSQRRKLLRHTRPGEARATPAHYDPVYLRGGTDRIVTSWIPIGDTPTEMGGLCYL